MRHRYEKPTVFTVFSILNLQTFEKKHAGIVIYEKV